MTKYFSAFKWVSMSHLCVNNLGQCGSDKYTYLSTPWSRVLLEKLTGFADNQEIPPILWNPKVQYRNHKGSPHSPIMPGR